MEKALAEEASTTVGHGHGHVQSQVTVVIYQTKCCVVLFSIDPSSHIHRPWYTVHYFLVQGSKVDNLTQKHKISLGSIQSRLAKYEEDALKLETEADGKK